MKKLSYLIVLTLILGLVLVGCNLLSNVGQVPPSGQNESMEITREVLPKEINLIAGQNTVAGNVTVTNDEENLYITYNTSDDWQINRTHLYVGKIAPTKSAPGRFPYKHESLGGVVKDYYEIPLNEFEVNLGDVVYIAAHADLVKGKKEEGGWAEGTEISPGKDWAMYFDYQLLEIEGIAAQILATQELGKQYFEQLNSQNDPDALQKTVDFLKTQPNVDNVEIGADGVTIWVVYKSGVEGIIFTESSRVLDGLSMSATYRSNLVTISRETTLTDKNAVIISPFFNSIEGVPESLDLISNCLQQSGYSPTNIERCNDENVTVNFMQTLSNYDFIYIFTHGSSRPTYEDASILTGERATYNLLADLWSYLINAKIQVGSTDDGDYFALSSKFFADYTYPDSIVHVDACLTLQNETMANVFCNHGAKVYLGWDNVSFATLVSFYSPKFYQELAKPNNTLQQAYNDTYTEDFPCSVYEDTNNNDKYRVVFEDGEDEGDPADTTFNYMLNFEYRGDSQFVLNSQQVVGQISGIVKDAVIQSPLQSVSIKVYDGNSLISSGTTDSSGVYSISVPAGSGYRVEFTKSGYIPAIYYDVSVVADVTTYLETVLQIDDSYSGQGIISGTISNALTGGGVSGLTIKFREGINVTSGTVITSTATGSGGYYNRNLYTGYYTAEVSGTGYNTTYFTVICIGGMATANQDATITPILSSGETRIILTWGVTPSDLDSHLTGPLPDDTRFHMYYPYAPTWGGSSPWPEYVKLDLDDITSYGPETTTIYQQIPGVYRFSVHDFTNGGSSYSTALSNSGAQVSIYSGDYHLATFNVPPSQGGTLWTVFEMDGDTIIPINTMFYESDPSVVRQSRAPDAELMKNLSPKK